MQNVSVLPGNLPVGAAQREQTHQIFGRLRKGAFGFVGRPMYLPAVNLCDLWGNFDAIALQRSLSSRKNSEILQT
jgi:hypothetical protein